jgi:RND family efflux transporter MFP subunit
VYEDGSMGGAGTGASGPPGTVTINVEKQQLIGVRAATVSSLPIKNTLRVLGRVAAAEDLTYRVIAANNGWMQDEVAPTTGSLVKKGEKLATLYHPDFLVAQQNYVLALHQEGRIPMSARGYTTQPDLVRGVERLRSALKDLGMSDSHIAELGHGRAPSSEIMLLAPATGIVLARNITPAQRVERGTELYRIADLNQVWIWADIYGAEEWHLKPGTVVRATLPDRQQTFQAKVSKTVPQFDPTTRTIKVRLEVDNPGFILRPDMFVDLEVPVTRPAALVVPADAVVDSGSKKVVYVAKADGVFEPRKVETGWRAGDQVEIVKGLMAGEKIVVSGTFLIDSESRMKAAAAGIYGETAEDPVCGMEVDLGKAKATGHTVTHQGQTYVFCSDECQTEFVKAPTKYTWKANPGAKTEAGKRLDAVQWDDPKPKTTRPRPDPAVTGHNPMPAVPMPPPAGHSHK